MSKNDAKRAKSMNYYRIPKWDPSLSADMRFSLYFYVLDRKSDVLDGLELHYRYPTKHIPHSRSQENAEVINF